MPMPAKVKPLLAALLLLLQCAAWGQQQGQQKRPPQRPSDQPSQPTVPQAPDRPRQDTPSSFEPSEKIRADSAISFPVDI